MAMGPLAVMMMLVIQMETTTPKKIIAHFVTFLVSLFPKIRTKTERNVQNCVLSHTCNIAMFMNYKNSQ